MRTYSIKVSGLALAALALSLTSCGEKIPSEAKLTTLQDSISYFVGYMQASQLPGIDLDYGLMARAMMDVKDSSNIEFSQEDQQRLFMALREQMMAEQQKEMESKGKENAEKGQAYLEENKKKEGVVVTASGLQYRVLKSGAGASPLDSNTVKVHYTGRFIDGQVFDSSVERGEPVTFPVNGVIPGWTEALKLMKPGDKWEVVIPSDLGYGPQGFQDIPPAATLVFEVELLEIMK